MFVIVSFWLKWPANQSNEVIYSIMFFQDTFSRILEKCWYVSGSLSVSHASSSSAV